jgi:hypothetical protein
MSERKGSLQLVSTGSSKFFGYQGSESEKGNQIDTIKIHKYRGSFGAIDENLFKSNKNFRNEELNCKKDGINILFERSSNIPKLSDKNIGYSSYQNTLEESLLSKLRKYADNYTEWDTYQMETLSETRQPSENGTPTTS